MVLSNVSLKFGKIWSSMKRKKKLELNDSPTPLKRCLTTFDLILLGIGNMTGSGIYVLTGSVMTDKSGPATFLSYLFAGIAAFLNAITYAELCSRMPKSGSAYLYTYVTGGEFLAFTIGWSIILEYVLSVSSVAKGWSGTVDTMTLGKISNETMNVFGRFPQSYGLSHYPDLLAVGIIIVFTIIISFGPKLSVMFNSTITIINITIIIFATGIMLSHPNKPLSYAPASKGGFLPFGISGVLAGAGTCFYSYIGFDAVTISSEEALDPIKSIPLANGISVLFVTLLFIVSSSTLPMFIEWYKVDPRAAFTSAFKYRGINWAAYVTGIGSLLGISASLFTSMYALPRLVYSMSSDGLLIHPLDYVSPKTQVPIFGLVIFATLAAFLALLLDIHTLADFLSIGTLIAYTLASVVLLILRYNRIGRELTQASNQLSDESVVDEIDEENQTGRFKRKYQRLMPDRIQSSNTPNLAIVLFIFFTACLACLIFKGNYYVLNNYWWAWIFLIVFVLGMIICYAILHSFEQYEQFNTFKVPYVPLLPLLTISLNIVLIINLSLITWIRFIIWLIIGLIMYFGYGMKHSKLSEPDESNFQPLISSNDEKIPNDDKVLNTYNTIGETGDIKK